MEDSVNNYTADSLFFFDIFIITEENKSCLIRHGLLPLFHISILSTWPSCGNDSGSYFKGTKWFHKRLLSLTRFAFLFFSSLKDRELLHSDFDALFSPKFPFLHQSLPTVRQELSKSKLDQKLHQSSEIYFYPSESRDFVLNQAFIYENLTLNITLCNHVCSLHAPSFKVRPWEEQETYWMKVYKEG